MVPASLYFCLANLSLSSNSLGIPANESQETLDYVNRVLKEERDVEFAAKPLETSCFQVENIKWAFVFYEDGLEVNVLYTVDDPKKRAVGFKLSEGMEVQHISVDLSYWERELLCVPNPPPSTPSTHDKPLYIKE